MSVPHFHVSLLCNKHSLPTIPGNSEIDSNRLMISIYVAINNSSQLAIDLLAFRFCSKIS